MPPASISRRTRSRSPGEVLGAGVYRHERHLVRIDACLWHGDETTSLELPRDRPGASQLAARLGEDRSDLGRSSVAIVRLGLDEDGHAAWSVALVDDLLELLGLASTRRLVDRSLDVVRGHVDRARLLDCEAESKVGVRIPAAGACRHGNFPCDLGEQRAALGVVGALLALDLGPLGVTGHRAGV